MSLFVSLGNLDPRSPAWYDAVLQNNMMRQRLAAQANEARSGGLGGMLGGATGGITGSLAEELFGGFGRTPHENYARRAAGVSSEPKEPSAKIGKVTPKPGYIYTMGDVRLKRWSDYSWRQKASAAWEVFKLWLRT